MGDNSIICLRNGINIVLNEAVVDLCRLSARLGDVILQKRDLIIMTEVLQEILKALLVNVLLLRWWLT